MRGYARILLLAALGMAAASAPPPPLTRPHPEPPMSSPFKKIIDSAKTLAREVAQEVIDIEATTLTGEAKRAEVIRRVARDADRAMRWPATPWGAVLEAVDGLIARAVIGLLVEGAVAAMNVLKKRQTPVSGS